MTDMRQKIVLCPPPDDEDDQKVEQKQQPGNIPGDEKGSRRGSSSAMPEELRQNFEVLKKRKVSDSEANRVAEETQAMIRAEVRRMHNAVAELEAYLHNVEEANEVAEESSDSGEFESDEEDDGGFIPADEQEELDRAAAAARKNRFPELPKVVVIESASTGDPTGKAKDEE